MSSGKISPTLPAWFWPRAIALLSLCLTPNLGSGQVSWAAAGPTIGFRSVQSALQRKGFVVKLTAPPRSGAYGLFQPSSRTIWINPIVFELEIAEQTIVHEAVHAAQFCRGQGTLAALQLSYEAPPQARRLYMRYNADQFRTTLEAEAYAVQAHVDRINQVVGLLNQHCVKQK
jgi:hypothetical protein